MAFDDRQMRVVMNGAQHRHVGVVLDDHPQLCLVPAAAEIVEDHAGDPDVAVERLVAENQRRDAARHAARVDHEHHRQREHSRQRRVAVAAVEREAVVEALVALDERDVGVARVRRERRQDFIRIGEIRVEIAAGPPGRRGQPHRIDEIRPLLERLDNLPARGQRGAQADAHRRLARRLVGGRYEQAGQRVRHQSAPAPSGADASSCGTNGSARTPASVIRKARPNPPTPSAISGRLGAYDWI